MPSIIEEEHDGRESELMSPARQLINNNYMSQKELPIPDDNDMNVS